MQIKTTKISNGRYMVEREDGEQFRIIRSISGDRWVIERQSDLALTDAHTLQAAKHAIQNKWEKATK